MANIGDDKRYGLIPAKKAQLSLPRPTNIFGDNSDSDSDKGGDWVKKAMKAGSKDTVKKQTQLDMQRALKEDPTIYQYDEVYDDMQRDKCEAEEKKKTVRKARYMENLIKTAERRKVEQEHRIERMVQKEREAEGEQFADKESFITSAYKAKLEEFKKLEEEEKRMERLEAIGDVTKQRDMTGFYRHMYRQKVEKVQLGEVEKTEEKADDSFSNMEDVDQDDAVTSESAAESDSEDNQKSKRIKLKHQRAFHNRRVYRRRQVESESDTDSSEEEEEAEANTAGYEPEESELEPEEPDCKRSRLEDSKTNSVDPQEASERLKAAKEHMDKIIRSIAGENEEFKPVVVKRSIWEKRCQGDLFEEAVTRYYGRKAERLANNVVY